MAAEQRFDSPPATLAVQPENIPAELKTLDQFVCWEWEFRNDPAPGKWTKPPLRANGAGYAKSTDPSTWTSFDIAYAAAQRSHWAGIGFALSKTGQICFLDLDHCRDPETGVIDPWAMEIIWAFRHTYHEISPSGTGVRIIGYGRLATQKHKKLITLNARSGASVELYDQGRYTTLTGHRCSGSLEHLADIQAALDALQAKLFPEPTPRPEAQSASEANVDDDDARLAVAFASRNGHNIRALFDGSKSGHGGDDSAADMALCNHLAFYFGPDPARIDRVFRRSRLMRDKWNQRHSGDGRTYGRMTIDAALAGKTEFYQPKPPKLRVVVGGMSFDETGKPTPIRGNRGDDHDDEGGETPPPSGDEKPSIFAQEQHLPTIAAEAWAAIKLANDPVRMVLFGDLPTRIDRAEDGSPSPQPLTEDRLLHELARAAHWWKYAKDPVSGEMKEAQAKPPRDVARDMLAASSFPLPGLVNIVQTPIFAKDGTLHATAGYHPATKTYYDPQPGIAIPAVSDDPTAEDVDAAKTLILEELLGEFPFTSAADRANAVCIFIEIVARNLINGPTPLRLISSPTPGTGKGLLADALLRHAVGRHVSIMPAANDDDEWRKRITAQLVQVPPAILIDNIVKAIDSGALAGALTAGEWKDRKLGATNMLRLPVRCLWIGTANNPTMSTEIARRTVQIHLDPKVDRPWQRVGFRHVDLRGWIDANRGQLIWSALTLIRHWMRQGGPLSAKRLGSFEAWASIMGGILEAAEIEGFLDNLDDFYEAADAEGTLWREFVKAWAEKFGNAETGVSDLFSLAETVDGFDFGKGSERAQKTAFGIALNRQRDRVIGDYRIVFAGAKQRAKRWRLLSIRPEDNPFARFHDDLIPENTTEQVNLVNLSEPLQPFADVRAREMNIKESPEVHSGSRGSLHSDEVTF